MQTLSEDYKALISELHEKQESWGSGSSRHAHVVADIAEMDETILDYGCGKGGLKRTLGTGYDVREYDPGIPGKEAAPEPADVVVCTDVLEHIEPEFIDKVISHIYALTKRKAYIIIAMRPARAILPDGRNAHLIIEGWDWWKEKLSKYFAFDNINLDTPKEVTLVLSPIRELKLIPGKGAIPDEVRNEQMRLCLARNPKRLELPEYTEAGNGRTAVLVCYGPSLKYKLPQIRKLQEEGADIITCSGAHDFLIENGIKPYAHSDIDGRAHKAALLNLPQPGVKYWMATVCHPEYFDKLANFDVSVFHIQNTEETAKWVDQNDPGSWLLTGGVTIGNRLLGLLYYLGYRTAHVFGMDCSYGIEGERHAGAHTGKEQMKMRVRCGHIWFDTSPQMVTAARDMIEMLGVLNPIGYDVTFHGNGLLQAMIAEATGLTGNE